MVTDRGTDNDARRTRPISLPLAHLYGVMMRHFHTILRAFGLTTVKERPCDNHICPCNNIATAFWL